MKKLIDAKLEQGDAIDTAATFGQAGEEAEGGEVLDLMEALRRSVERNRADRGKDEAEKPAEEKEEAPAPAKRRKRA